MCVCVCACMCVCAFVCVCVCACVCVCVHEPSHPLTPSLPHPQMLKFRVTKRDLHLEHIAMADLHFSEERARAMEIAARRLKNRSTFSVTSDVND